MRAREFVREDGWGPAQQAAVRAGLPMNAPAGWGPAQQAAVRAGLPIKGPPPAAPSAGHSGKRIALVGAAMMILDGYNEITSLPPTLSTEAKTREITRIISRLVAEFGIGWVGAGIGACLAGAVSMNPIVTAIGGVGGAIAANSAAEDTVAELVKFIVHTLYDQRQPANQRPVGPETGKQPWDHPSMNEDSASDINPNTGKPYTTDEWDRYWNPGAGRPYTEKEKEMFANPDVTAKSVGKEVLRRIPGIGALINIGDAVKGFKDLSR